MEEAAEALQAIMQDLAAQKPQPDAPALLSAEQPAAADPEAEGGEAGATQEAMDSDGEPGLGFGDQNSGGLPQAAPGSCAAATVAERVRARRSRSDCMCPGAGAAGGSGGPLGGCASVRDAAKRVRTVGVLLRLNMASGRGQQTLDPRHQTPQPVCPCSHLEEALTSDA